MHTLDINHHNLDLKTGSKRTGREKYLFGGLERFEMLKGINPILNADVLQVLRAMGHGDDLIISDSNFPSDSVARQTITGKLLRIEAGATEVVHAVLSVMPLDSFVDDAAARMEVVGEPEAILPVMHEVQAEVNAVGGPKKLLPLNRYAFYDRSKEAYAIIQTGEPRFYGCFAFRKGVIGPTEE